ncbi:MAG: helix-turn-helix domain-containing protein [Parasphingopyxis sp.]|nr:helix-turn-helix domain-containing protein [Sphingomonadales bacterium]
MNGFERLAAELERFSAGEKDAELEISTPARPDGIWLATLHGPGGYAVEAEWSRHRGFGLIAGEDLGFSAAAHENHSSWESAFARMIALWNARAATSADYPVPIADLRKLRGQLQKDVASHMGITKGGLAQIESSTDKGKVQLETLDKLIVAMGGRLIISATFPDGTERKVSFRR